MRSLGQSSVSNLQWCKKMNYDRVLVTGGAGFIGSHTVDALLSEDVTIWILDDLSTGARSNLLAHRHDHRLRFVSGTVTNPKTVGKLTEKVDAVIHLAAVVSPVVSIAKPEVVNDINVTGTLNVLRASSKSRVKRLVFASSSSVYGDTGTHRKISELASTGPLNPYGVSKLAGEKYCAAFYTTYDLDTVSLRYFNVYGDRQMDNPYSGVIAIFANAILARRKTHINGNGRQTRDFVHVTDVARANLAALNCRSGRGEAINIGTGIPTSINTLHGLVAESTSQEVPEPTHRLSRIGDICHSCANISKARRILKFTPQVNLQEGLARLTTWLRSSKP